MSLIIKCLCQDCNCWRSTECGICTRCVYGNHCSKTKEDEGKVK